MAERVCARHGVVRLEPHHHRKVLPGLVEPAGLGQRRAEIGLRAGVVRPLGHRIAPERQFTAVGCVALRRATGKTLDGGLNSCKHYSNYFNALKNP